jgi:hypothetical protein
MWQTNQMYWVHAFWVVKAKGMLELRLTDPRKWRRYAPSKCLESVPLLLSVTSQKTRILNIKGGETLNLKYQNVYCGLLGYDAVQSGTRFMWNVTDTSWLTNWQLEGGKFMMYQQFNFLLSKPVNWAQHSKYPQADQCLLMLCNLEGRCQQSNEPCVSICREEGNHWEWEKYKQEEV